MQSLLFEASRQGWPPWRATKTTSNFLSSDLQGFDSRSIRTNMSRSLTESKEKTPPAKPEKIKVHFVSVGAAPIMKKTKFQISADQRFASVHIFLRKVLKLQPGDSLFLYLHAAFCPGPDELLRDLNETFSKRGELVVHYSLQQAWG
mmetsp:Transcript_12904/g.32526  ORF Transcript_12904/g.32526 Transcript_12904/m.32526 type:complete len:147 (+) Transcript_12904:42-482(+)